MAQDVSEVILAKIRSGALPPPTGPPAKCYAGKGTGRMCDACANVIAPSDVEVEVDLTSNKMLIFHRDCHGIWQDAAVGA
jgi:hypothetical protein